MRDKVKWDLRYLLLAAHVGTWSKDPSTKVGAVITSSDGKPVSFGFNGLPAQINDDPEILNDRERKYNYIIHGEINALLFAGGSVSGNTLYTFPFRPCPRCAVQFVQAGISRVVFPMGVPERWEDACRLTDDIFRQAGVETAGYVDSEILAASAKATASLNSGLLHLQSYQTSSTQPHLHSET